MAFTELPFSLDQIQAINRTYPTPFYIYDEAGILKSARQLRAAMQKVGFADFGNYFAVKALPNPHILQLLMDEDKGFDCSSMAELELAAQLGARGKQIMFSSNDTADSEYQRAKDLDAVINFDDITHIQPFIEKFGLPSVVSCRYNPGDIETGGESESIIGRPSEAKFGMTKPQIIEAYKQLKTAGATELWLHAMPVSNNLDVSLHLLYVKALFELAREISETVGVTFTCINLGGGIGVPYRPEDQPFNLDAFADGVRAAYEEAQLEQLGKPSIVMESGRYITAESGYLITKVIHTKDTYRHYVGVDASMADLMRPGMYGAYHHITVLGKESQPNAQTVDVVGSLCENNDKFAVGRALPATEIGDYLVIHTTGAHGHAMGFQYNGKLRSAELLLNTDGTVKCIRRAETLDDYFSTLHGNGVAKLERDKE